MKIQKLMMMFVACVPMALMAQTFDLTKAQPAYSDSLGYGYDILPAPTKKSTAPFYFSVKVPDGNYRVQVTLGSKRRSSQTVVRAESRKLMVEDATLRKGKYATYTFTVQKRSPYINDQQSVSLHPRENGTLTWDDKLTLELNGSAPAVSSISITPDTTATTLYLCGNSTVVDQTTEPWASWGQMIPRWFNDQVVVANYAESGLSATSFLAQRRLDKILTMLRKGDYVVCEFGHNDQKERQPGAGAWYNFSYNLKRFVDQVRAKEATIIFVTPTRRRTWDESHQHILDTHGDYPAAMRAVAQRENVPVIELQEKTRNFFEALGYEDSKRALVHYPAGTFPGQATALADNTHFNPYGAYEVAKMVVMGMKELHLPLVANLRDDWKDFFPAQPDDWRAFKCYPASMTDTTKPLGT